MITSSDSILRSAYSSSRYWRTMPYCWDGHGRRHGQEDKHMLHVESAVASAVNKMKVKVGYHYEKCA
jgi:hypothetical protein